MAKNITNETNTKVVPHLETVPNKENPKSAQSLIERDDSSHEGVNTQEDITNKNFILEKFLKSDNLKENDNATFIKPPIPKPRKKTRQQSSGCSEAHSAKSTNILNVIDSNSTINNTCDLPRRTSRRDSDSSGSSAKTYDVHKTPTTDTLYRDKVNKTSIIEFHRGCPVQRSSKSYKISQHEIEMAEFSDESDKVQTIEEILQETETRSAHSGINTKITYENELKGKKKRKKKENVIDPVQEPFRKYDQVLSIVLHHTDRLERNSLVIHPVIKVHLVDYETGEYIKKTDNSIGAVFHTESKNLTYIMPVITQSFSLEEDREYKPEWEESIIINEDFNYIVNPATRVILFFELLDFVGFSEAAVQSSVYSRGWHRIAWAFLKINGANGTTNTGKKLRLQLYKPGKDISNSCPAFEWWRGKRNKYPSTLYVTVKEITSPDTVVETFRSKTPFEKEKSASILDENGNSKSDDKSMEGERENVKPALVVLENDICKLPNTFLTDVESGDEGCFVLKFSNTGKFLACAVNIKNNYTLVLYTVPEFETYYKLPSHKELIYNISFSKDDSLLASSSSDGTVCIWNLDTWSFLQILPHPSFVYWCEIASDHAIATACYDKTVRIWNASKNKPKKEYFLVHELGGHIGYVTSLCFNSNASILYSSDSIGEIFLWKRGDRTWKHLKTIKLPELTNTLINQIFLKRKERKLIVHARDSIIRIIDVKHESVVHWLEGALNIRVRTSCCTTPCGTYVMCGSDNGVVHVWNANNGIPITTYQPYSKIPARHIPIHAVDFSPVGNMIAFGHFGRTVPIQVHGYDPMKCSDKLSVINEEKLSKSASQTTKAKKDKSDHSDEKEDSEKDVDLKTILEKIDRIIK